MKPQPPRSSRKERAKLVTEAIPSQTMLGTAIRWEISMLCMAWLSQFAGRPSATTVLKCWQGSRTSDGWPSASSKGCETKAAVSEKPNATAKTRRHCLRTMPFHSLAPRPKFCEAKVVTPMDKPTPILRPVMFEYILPSTQPAMCSGVSSYRPTNAIVILSDIWKRANRTRVGTAMDNSTRASAMTSQKEAIIGLEAEMCSLPGKPS
mmetsp:Transcript_111429/g.310300  ORF Transcript_111429/g.310300 Transcript_111429/m.310300 type:complete len:207 (+) Transcript_111429:402-1022(+)